MSRSRVEGWYLMSTPELETFLKRSRAGEDIAGIGIPLSDEEALAFRDAGNVPDGNGRSLRLVLSVGSTSELKNLHDKRRSFEPDYLDAPSWRREGSKPVNVVPLRPPEVRGDPVPWWEEERVSVLEAEWAERGTIAGLRVPGEYRSFVHKAVLSLRDAGAEVSAESVVAAVSRWLPPQEVEEIRAALDGPD